MLNRSTTTELVLRSCDDAYYSLNLNLGREKFSKDLEVNLTSEELFYMSNAKCQCINVQLTTYTQLLFVSIQIDMFYLNTIEQLFLFVEQLFQLEVCLPYSRLLAGIPILAVFQNLRWNSNKTPLRSKNYLLL